MSKVSDQLAKPVEDPKAILGTKFDYGKPDMSLLMPMGEAITAVAEVMTHGLKKYQRDNWLYVENGFERYTAAMLRHLMQECAEEFDPNTHCLHAAHVACNALMRLQRMLVDQAELNAECDKREMP